MSERMKIKIGAKVKAKKQVPGKHKGTYHWVKGRVVEVYSHVIVVDFGKYKESFNEADIATGEAQVI